jgi:riboflavin transporter 2
LCFLVKVFRSNAFIKSFLFQVANIAPLAFTLATVLCPHRNFEVPVIYGIIVIGAISCLLLVFFWDAVAVVAGEKHSVGLLLLQFFLALVDCTSSVAYLPFMSAFNQKYLTAFYVGEGFSGLIPSLVSLAQGAGDIRCVNQTSYINVTVDGATDIQPSFSVYPVYETPRFSIEIFFLFLFAMLIVSLVSFTLLNYWPYAKREKVGSAHDLAQQFSQRSSGSYELNAARRDSLPRLVDCHCCKGR